MSTDSIEIRGGLIVMDHNNDWAEFKKWINGNYAHLRYVWGRFGNGFMDPIYEDASIPTYQDERSYYKIIAMDDKVIRTVVIPISKPKSLDQLDFEDNFKSDVLPVREEFDNGEIFETRFVGYIYNCPVGQSTHEIKLSKSVNLEGLRYWTQGSTVGDTISFSVVDKDNLFGFGANYILDEIIIDAPVPPSSFGQQEFSFNKAYLSSNLYLIIEYLNSGDAVSKLGVTYRWLEAARLVTNISNIIGVR